MKKAFIPALLLSLGISSLFAQTASLPGGYLRRETVDKLAPVRVEAPTASEIAGIVKGNDPRAGGMYIIGLNQPTDLGTANAGTWTSEDDNKVWRLKIKSDGAQALHLLYSEFYLPEGGQVFVYNADYSHKSRAYLGNENPGGASFATEAIVGDETVLEYTAPAYVTEAPRIRIEAVDYIFRSAQRFSPKNAGENGDSDPCEVNVNCPEGSAWKDQKRGVAKIIVRDGSTSGLCTGSLVNNTSLNCRNYFLTAQHCGGAATTANLNQWIFYFNFESPDCNNLTNTEAQAADNQTRTGCARRASSGTVSEVEKSDFLLVEINGTIPAAYNVFYNGWDRASAAATSGVGIHHPAGDIKKISTYSANAVSSSWGGTSGSHWRVTWVATASGHGVTEGGSSGSPLFNQNKRIVGDLSGGGSECTSTSSPDLYGKFWYSWDQAGTTAATRLKPWLDSIASNVTVLDGKQGCSNSQLGVPLNGETSLQANVYPNPASGNFTVAVGGTGNAPVNVTVIDLTGRAIFQTLKPAGTPLVEINTEAWAAGLYQVQVKTDGKSVTRKVYVNGF